MISIWLWYCAPRKYLFLLLLFCSIHFRANICGVVVVVVWFVIWFVSAPAKCDLKLCECEFNCDHAPITTIYSVDRSIDRFLSCLWTIWFVCCFMSNKSTELKDWEAIFFSSTYHDRHCLLTANGWRDFVPMHWKYGFQHACGCASSSLALSLCSVYTSHCNWLFSLFSLYTSSSYYHCVFRAHNSSCSFWIATWINILDRFGLFVATWFSKIDQFHANNICV